MYWTHFNYSARAQDPAQTIERTKLDKIIVMNDVLEPNLFRSLQVYVAALKERGLLVPDEMWGGRKTRNNDPFLCFIHDMLTPVVYSRIKIPVKPSYNFLSCYDFGGNVPKHKDRPQCRYTLDLMVDHADGLDWSLYVEHQEVVLHKNSATIYSGTDHLHWREKSLPDGQWASLVFFHFVNHDFQTGLD